MSHLVELLLWNLVQMVVAWAHIFVSRLYCQHRKDLKPKSYISKRRGMDASNEWKIDVVLTLPSCRKWAQGHIIQVITNSSASFLQLSKWIWGIGGVLVVVLWIWSTSHSTILSPPPPFPPDDHSSPYELGYIHITETWAISLTPFNMTIELPTSILHIYQYIGTCRHLYIGWRRHTHWCAMIQPCCEMWLLFPVPSISTNLYWTACRSLKYVTFCIFRMILTGPNRCCLFVFSLVWPKSLVSFLFVEVSFSLKICSWGIKLLRFWVPENWKEFRFDKYVIVDN